MPKGKFLGTTHLSRALCSVRISVTAMAQGRSWYQGQTRMFLFTRGTGRAAEISAPCKHAQPAWGWRLRAGGDLVLGRHFCSRQEDAPREEGRKKRLTLLFLYLGQRFNSKQNIWHGVGIPRGKASWKSPQSQAPEPWVPGDSLWGCCSNSHLW